MTSLLKTLIIRDLASDAQLLGRFVRDRDDAAFTELVRRHGPLVLGVCRRVILDRHLADDAFQAAFVVLARKAESVQPDKLASWLYGVSYKVALRARTMAGRRAKHETLTATLPETPVSPDPVDDGVLDAEIANLPALYRDAVVLCELQGVSRHDAAKTLGILEGTLSSRLAKARKLLAVALGRRGVTMPATLAVTTTVTLELCTSTVRAATGTLAPPLVATLANGVLRTMLLSKLKLAAVIGVCAAMLLSLGIGSITRPKEALAAPVPMESKDEGLLWLHDPEKRELVAHSPDGELVRTVMLHDGMLDTTRFLGMTRDGANAMFVANKTLHLQSLHFDDKPFDTGIACANSDTFVTSPDGQHIYRRHDENFEQMGEAKRPNNTVTRFDVTGKNAKTIDLPIRYGLREVLSMGEFLLDSENRTAGERNVYRCTEGGKVVCDTHEMSVDNATYSPDRKTLLMTELELLKGFERYTLVVKDVESGKKLRIDGVKDIAYIRGFWSPDGKQIAMQWHNFDSLAGNTPPPGEVIVCEADGTKRKRILQLEVASIGKPFESKRHLIGWYPAKAAAKRIAPVPKAEPDVGLLWLHDTKAKKLIAKSPDGRTHKEIDLPEGDRFIGFTTDGVKILFAGKGGKVVDAGVSEGLTLHLRSDFAKAEGTDTGLGYRPNDFFVFSPDGKQIVRQRLDKVGGRAKHEYSHLLFDMVTKKETKIDLPSDHQLMQWSADGKTWWVVENNNEYWMSMPAGGGKSTRISDAGSFLWLDPSPNGKTFLATGYKLNRIKLASEAVFHIDTASGKVIEVKAFDEVAFLVAWWSPDGHRIGCMKYDSDSANNRLGDSHLLILDADGKNEKTLLTIKGDHQKTRFLGWFSAAK